MDGFKFAFIINGVILIIAIIGTLFSAYVQVYGLDFEIESFKKKFKKKNKNKDIYEILKIPKEQDELEYYVKLLKPKVYADIEIGDTFIYKLGDKYELFIKPNPLYSCAYNLSKVNSNFEYLKEEYIVYSVYQTQRMKKEIYELLKRNCIL